MGDCTTSDLSHVVLHSLRIKALKSVCHFHFSALAVLEAEKWKPEVRWENWAVGLSLWAWCFEPQDWISHALRQSQKSETDLKHIWSARVSEKILILFLYHCTVLWDYILAAVCIYLTKLLILLNVQSSADRREPEFQTCLSVLLLVLKKGLIWKKRFHISWM